MDSVGRENLLINGTRCTVGKAKVYRRLPALSGCRRTGVIMSGSIPQANVTDWFTGSLL